VLTGLIKRTSPALGLENVGAIADLDRLYPAAE